MARDADQPETRTDALGLPIITIPISRLPGRLMVSGFEAGRRFGRLTHWQLYGPVPVHGFA